MGFPYFDMELSTRFPYSKAVLFIFFSVNEFVISLLFPRFPRFPRFPHVETLCEREAVRVSLLPISK